MNRRVVLAGWGQVTQSGQTNDDDLLDPIGLMAAASQRAFEMTGSSDAVRHLDGLMTVKVMRPTIRPPTGCSPNGWESRRVFP